MPTLNLLKVGQQGLVRTITGEAALVQRFYELGLYEGEEIRVLAVAPLGDPIEILCGNSRLSLRRKEAAGIEVDFPPG